MSYRVDALLKNTKKYEGKTKYKSLAYTKFYIPIYLFVDSAVPLQLAFMFFKLIVNIILSASILKNHRNKL